MSADQRAGKLIAEGAYGTTTPEADRELNHASAHPRSIVQRQGMISRYLEQVQSNMNSSWGRT